MIKGAGEKKSDSGTNRPDGGIAQLGEHLLCKQGVNGSIPFISTRPDYESNPEKKVVKRRPKADEVKAILPKGVLPRNGLIAQPVRAHA